MSSRLPCKQKKSLYNWLEWIFFVSSSSTNSLDERGYETCFEVHNTFTCLSQSLWKYKIVGNERRKKSESLILHHRVFHVNHNTDTHELTRIKSWIRFESPRLARTKSRVTGPGIPSVYPSPLWPCSSLLCSPSTSLFLASCCSLPELPLTS